MSKREYKRKVWLAGLCLLVVLLSVAAHLWHAGAMFQWRVALAHSGNRLERWHGGQRAFFLLVNNRSSVIRDYLHSTDPNVRFTAACAALNHATDTDPFDNRGQGQVTESQKFSVQDIDIAFRELARGFGSRDPATLGQRCYIAEHLHAIYDSRLIPILSSVIDDDAAVFATGEMGARGVLADLTGLDYETDWAHWSSQNYSNLLWDGKQFVVSEKPSNKPTGGDVQ